MLASLVYRVPVFGRLIREAAEGSATAKVLFLVNIVLAWVLAIMMFGYPAIILPALAAVPAMFIILMLITVGK